MMNANIDEREFKRWTHFLVKCRRKCKHVLKKFSWTKLYFLKNFLLLLIFFHSKLHFGDKKYSSFPIGFNFLKFNREGEKIFLKLQSVSVKKQFWRSKQGIILAVLLLLKRYFCWNSDLICYYSRFWCGNITSMYGYLNQWKKRKF